jgi:peptide/nickel transport system substrate-binding protein
VRLESQDGAQGFEYVDVPDADTQVDLFLSGDLNFIANPPYERRADIRAASDVQVYGYPGTLWYYIGFNLVNPFEPASAFDEDGNPLDQGHHPLFGDVRVRRAVQMALDVNTLIEASVYGDGTVMAANQPPGSWAFNDDLAPIGYDPVGAERLLDEAGWRDWNRDGVRECRGCLYAEEGAPLSFTLLYNGDNFRLLSLSQVITRQLRQAGIDAFAQPTGGSAFNEAVFQQFDAYLSGWFESYPVNPDQAELFTTAGDVVGEGFNTTSYANERVAELLRSARTVPGCDGEARATIYREIQTILQEDQPYAWLLALNDMVAARGSVIGFNPYPHAPLWNVRDWVVVE